MSGYLVLEMMKCFHNNWKTYGGVGWGCSGKGSSAATIVMTHDTSSSCPGINEKHRIRVGESAYFDNNTWEVVVNSVTGSGSSAYAVVELFEVEEEPEPEPDDPNMKTARINNFSISGHSPYMVGMMINFNVEVEWLKDTDLCIVIRPGYIRGGTWYSCTPMCAKNTGEKVKGTKIRYKGAFKIDYSMFGHNDEQLAVYFMVTDNNSGIEVDYKFIPIEVIETTYPDDHPIWDDPDPVDPDPDPVNPDDPDVIPEKDNNIWFYVTLILFVGLIGAILWSSR